MCIRSSVDPHEGLVVGLIGVFVREAEVSDREDALGCSILGTKKVTC